MLEKSTEVETFWMWLKWLLEITILIEIRKVDRKLSNVSLLFPTSAKLPNYRCILPTSLETFQFNRRLSNFLLFYLKFSNFSIFPNTFSNYM